MRDRQDDRENGRQDGVGRGDLCFVCRKHGDLSPMPGGPVGADNYVVVSHLSPKAPGRSGLTAYLGQLLVEPRRHARRRTD
jgi:histidine triad (HIT) family protein